MSRHRRAVLGTLVPQALLVLVGSGFTACGPAPVAGVPHREPGDAPVLPFASCPVTGARYTDDYGPRGTGFHYGIDMMVPIGTPARAVRAGTVRYVANEGAGGNVAYLTADDGNVYLYAHLNDFWGTDRHVEAGELIAHTGQTGNATAPHVHFEIRLGGVNGTRVDPYPSLRANGC
jgi:murein DD-endopeptidase MepM/ murein hydrolase activator NlpD